MVKVLLADAPGGVGHASGSVRRRRQGNIGAFDAFSLCRASELFVVGVCGAGQARGLPLHVLVRAWFATFTVQIPVVVRHHGRSDRTDYAGVVYTNETIIANALLDRGRARSVGF